MTPGHGTCGAVLGENLRAIGGGYLGELREVLRLRVEEFAPTAEPSLSGGPAPNVVINGLAAGTARAWGEVVRLERAQVESTCVGAWLDGPPAITKNSFGKGTAWHLATAPVDLSEVIDDVLSGTDLVNDMPGGLEVVERGHLRFLMNKTTNDIVVGDRTVSAATPSS